MASPFKKKSPLNAYKYSLTSEYAKPKRVIQPIVEADAAKAIDDASKKVLGVYSKIEADKLAKTASDEAGDLKHQRAMEVKWGKGNTGPAVKPASHEENMSNLGLKSYKNTQVEDFMNRDFGGNKDPNSLVDIGKDGRINLGNNIQAKSDKKNTYTYKMAHSNLSKAEKEKYGSLDNFSKKANETAIPGSENYANKDGTRDEVNSTPWNPQMKGSPVKHNAGAVGSIASGGGQNNPSKSLVALFGQDKANNMQQKMTAMKSQQSGSGIFGTIAQAASQGGSAVGSISREGVLAADTGVDASLPPPNQVAETGSYGGGGDRILEMDSNPVGNQSIGRDTDVASQLFGSGQRASMLAMKGTPLHHDEDHADNYEGHTHRKKGKSYEVGESIDETDFESLNTLLNAYDRGEIQKDKKSQFIVTKNTDFNPVKTDTIRPKNGKQFKMGWGDAERNISTNPKYKKSK